jgi:dolichol-phosphate mannosyltransferase
VSSTEPPHSRGDASNRPLLSVVCPVYFDEDGIAELYQRLSAAVLAISPPVDHELVFVNDGSTDASLERLKALTTDPRVRVIDLSRNFGHQLAITAGMDHARGDAVVVIDSDLQDPPEVIADMVEKWREGYRVVYGVRTHRSGETRWKLFTAKTFYRLVNRLSDTALPLDSGDFRLLDRQVVEVLREMREENRYVRGLVAWAGFRQYALPYQRDARFAGESGYTLRKQLQLAVNAVTSFSEKPLRLALQLGALVTSATALVALWIIVATLLQPERTVPGFGSLMVAILFFGGVQLLCLGAIGEYLGRVYREVKSRPLYIVAERVGFDQPVRATSSPPAHAPSTGRWLG